MALTEYEQLCDTAYAQLIDVFEHALPARVRGLYYEDGLIKSITINKGIDTGAEKLCVLAEELGHSFYGGDFIHGALPDALKRKIERLARVWAYKRLLPAKKLLAALKDPCYNNNCEIAEEFGVTEEFLCEATEYYKVGGIIPPFIAYDESDFCS